MLCLSDTIGKKAYTCQKCGASRDVEEINKMRSEILQLSDKASSFLSSGSILV
jgi:[histone H3]-lysine4/36 N-trimethyltransferase SMYD